MTATDDIMAVCRSDRVRLVSEVPSEWTDDLAYEILVNPFSPDFLLLAALEKASDVVLERTARHSCHVANLRTLPSLPPSPTTSMLHGNIVLPQNEDKYELTKRLAKAANGDWGLAEQVVDWLNRP